MATLIKIVVAVLAGLLLGLLLTIHSLDVDKLGISAGPWHSLPRDGASADRDPYALAADARASLLPLGVSEGLTFLADRDSDGTRLQPDCDYLVDGPMPPTRFWTLSLLTPAGFPIANAADRYGFTSAEILRLNTDPPQILVSRRARAGNWLPVGDTGAIKLMLRLYDTSLSTTGDAVTVDVMPRILRQGCE